MNYAERRKLQKRNRTGGISFHDNYLPKAMSVEQINQILDLQRQAQAPHERPEDIVIPTRTGEMLSTAAYKLNQAAQRQATNVVVETQRFRERLRTEAYEDVTNWDAEPFIGMLNGVRYAVPARGTKRLPRTLAQHFREKKGLQAKGQEYEQRLGQLRGGAEPELLTQEFEQRVRSFDAMEYENSQREEIF